MIKLWEAVALTIVAQANALDWPLGDYSGLLGEFCQSVVRNGPTGQEIAGNGILDRVYRQIEESKADEPYPVVLARELGCQQVSGSMKIRFKSGYDVPVVQNAIILAPFGIRRDLELPMVVWRHVARFMRSYGRPVLLLGDRTSRLDVATFTEGELLGRQSFEIIMSMLRKSAVVVGVPNEWTWLAASVDSKIVMLYPDNQPPRRWFWYPSSQIGRAVFTPTNVQTPIILTAIRKLVEVL